MDGWQDIADRLMERFPQAELASGASSTELSALHDLYGAGADEMLQWLSVCNGIDCGIKDSCRGILYSAQKILDATRLFRSGGKPERVSWLPFADDECGDYDCVECSETKRVGSVFFLEQYHEPCYLLAGSFSSYLRFWSDSLLQKYLPDGTMDPRFKIPDLPHPPWLGEPEMEHPWPFDSFWLALNDPNAARILSDRDLSMVYSSVRR